MENHLNVSQKKTNLVVVKENFIHKANLQHLVYEARDNNIEFKKIPYMIITFGHGVEHFFSKRHKMANSGSMSTVSAGKLFT